MKKIENKIFCYSFFITITHFYSIFFKNYLQITLDNSKNIVSLNQNREEHKQFKALFKKYFSAILSSLFPIFIIFLL